MARIVIGPIESAVRAELTRDGIDPATVGAAQLAVTIARRIDGGDLADRDLSALSGRLTALLTRPTGRPDVAEVDPIDELRQRRAAARGEG